MRNALFASDLWTSEPPEGEIFIWAYPIPSGGWSTGMGYWTVTKGRWMTATGGAPRGQKGLRYHPMPDPDNRGPRYVVWSHEHAAWWAPGRCGYTPALADAGLYTREQAIGIARDAGAPWMIGKAPNEIAVRLEDALAAQELPK